MPLFPSLLILKYIPHHNEKRYSLVQRLENYTDSDFPVAWDTETTGLDPIDAELVGIGCAWGENITDIAYIPVGHVTGQQLSKPEVLQALKPLLECDRYPKVFQNTKFDRLILKYQGINVNGVVLDTSLASYVLQPEQSHNLTDLCRRYLSDKPGIIFLSYKDLGLPKDKTIADLDIATAAEYCSLDAYATYLLIKPLKTELNKYPDLENLLTAIELPLEAILAEMEYRGVHIDRDYLAKLSQQLEANLQLIETDTYRQAGETFNLGSPKQLGDILFEKLGLEPV